VTVTELTLKENDMRKSRKLTLSRETIHDFEAAAGNVWGGISLPCKISVQVECPLSHNCPLTFGCPPPVTLKC
jgi:hypothetical protein